MNLLVTRAAARDLGERLPQAVAAAALELIRGDLLSNPRRVGAALRNPLEGTWAARRGTYRILFTLDEDAHTVTVVRVEHRANAYRPR